MFLNSVLEDGGQVLVAGAMKGEPFSQRLQRSVSPRLGPAIGVHVRVKPTIGAAMDVGAAAEDGLRKDDFHFRLTPILNPLLKEVELPLTKQDGSFDVYTCRVIIRVPDMVRPRALLGDSTGRAGLEFSIFDEGEIDIAPIQVGVPDTDPLVDLMRINGIGQMARLCAFHFLDVNRGSGVTAVRRATER